jgi:predicted GNAT family acetyltransferase
MVPWRINCVLSCVTNVDLDNQCSRTQKATAITVRDNKFLSRFELDVEGAIAFANYRHTPGTVIITHTETPRAMRGRGIASELLQCALELIRADGDKVVAGCGFVVHYLRKHPGFSDLAR